MTRRRWIADQVEGDRALLLGAHARHLSQVLRAEVGQKFDVSTGAAVRRGRILKIEPDRVEFELGAQVEAGGAALVTLVLGIFKFDRLEWAIEKATELGVARIVPVVAQRTDVHLARAAVKRADRWMRIAREAAEQSRRVAPPEILPPIKLKEAVAMPASARFLLSESEKEISLRDALASADASSVALAAGPEGGWAEKEQQLFSDAGWTGVSLGPTILRAETAALAALAVVMSELA